MATTYTKLNDGSWGVRGSKLTTGATVTVSKRDGSSKTETVGRVLWTGADGTCLATISQTHQSGSVSRPSGRSQGRGVWNGCSCGAREMPDGSLSANACRSCRFDHDDC